MTLHNEPKAVVFPLSLTYVYQKGHTALHRDCLTLVY